MPLVTVKMQVEVGDIGSFYPDEPPGITIENVAGLLQNVVVERAYAMVKLAAQETDLRKLWGNEAYDRLMEAGADDHEVAKRLLKSLEIELDDTSN
jgi:hypothetical protein